MNQMTQTRKILAYLNGQIGTMPEPGTDAKLSPEPQTVLVVFSGNPIDLDTVLVDLSLLKSQGWTFDLAFSANAESLININRIISQLSPSQVIKRDMRQLGQYRMEHLQCVMAPLVTHNTARKLSLGIQDGLVPNLLWQALWEGVPVYMNLNSLLAYHGRPAKNLRLEQMMRETISALQEMGVRLLDRPAALLSADNVKQDQPETRTKRRIITEQDILRHNGKDSVLEIPADAIVTPLAHDTAKVRGIRFSRK